MEVEENHEGMLNISHFAALSGVSRQTLIYYDRIGIFCPARVSDKGYRYYQIQQIEAVESILALRELDVPLEEIKSYLKDRNPEKCMQILNQQREKIRERIRKLECLDETVALRIALTVMGNEALEKGAWQLQVVDKKELKYIAVLSTGSKAEDVFRDILALERIGKKYNKNARDALGAVIKREDILSGNCQKIYEFFIPLENDAQIPEMSVRPGGRYAVIYHKGPYEKTNETYTVLLKSLEEQGLEIDGDSFETGVHDFFTVRESSDYLTVLEVPVKETFQ